MKTKKLNFEDFKENQLGRKQTVTILGGAPPPGEAPTGDELIGPSDGGGLGNNSGNGIANPKP